MEYLSCLERLEELGLEEEEISRKALDCSICSLRGRCTVERVNPFLGAKTC